ncbi:MAG: Holliday junction branch migration protein RuvA [Erysipelotrichaceae bacterium]|nr:Holliday junction branch migration protein RuvA [Erysipelotrichaceae bacterium]
MIAYVRGILAQIGENEIIVEAGQIGYRLFVPASVLPSLPGIGEEVKMHTFFYVREDTMQLYGFLTWDDKELFRILIGVSGIGPKGALAILSTMSPDDLRFAVLADDAKSIARTPGIGLKTAQKLIIEVKDKIHLSGGEEELTAITSAPGQFGSLRDEAVAALMALGYSSSEALRAVRSVSGDEFERVEDLLRAALKGLAQ